MHGGPRIDSCPIARSLKVLLQTALVISSLMMIPSKSQGFGQKSLWYSRKRIRTFSDNGSAVSVTFSASNACDTYVAVDVLQPKG